ncbi:MAG: hypothetical protein OJK14_18665, partial [Achromobacter sp.]|nr:hypothetical protein [Achromobacter sp.]
SLLYLGLMLATSGACAQEADVRAAPPDGAARELDTIHVEGQRVGLNLDQESGVGVLGSKRLLDTPFSVTVVDEQDINRRGATTL